jgi:chemotaxis protein methyltransferase CheR
MTNEVQKIPADTQDIKDLIAAIQESKGIDLSDYAESSLQRRIKRFNEITRLENISQLINKIRYEKGFTDYFINEITVSVTEMFRDPGFWVGIRDCVIKELENQALINIWHAGCSMGEEVYTMAILLKEAGLYHKARIIATDINLDALKKAKEGIYLLKNQTGNAGNYQQAGGKAELKKYYREFEGKVLYDRELISRVEFRRHDLSSEGTFGTFDLIICRNVFIYFNFNLQEKVLNLFYNSMDKGSFLGIGSKESINWFKGARHFDIVSLEEKIFRKNG